MQFLFVIWDVCLTKCSTMPLKSEAQNVTEGFHVHYARFELLQFPNRSFDRDPQDFSKFHDIEF